MFQCVICVNAKATMQTSPCGHRVVCRKCFVKTIQMAVSQRILPLRYFFKHIIMIPCTYNTNSVGVVGAYAACLS